MAYVLDDIDKRILNLLQEDSRLSNKQLAHLLHRSPNPTYVRVKRLQDEGYIRRYTTILNPKKIGRGVTVFTSVKLKEHSQKSLKAFMREVAKLDEIMECYHMSGDSDFILKIVIGNLDEYNHLMMEQLSNLPDVATMESTFVMSEVKHETRYGLEKS
ncbi:Lrp/AsnC family transcriptional regulator [Mucilaginibacter sp. Mucisp84]|uniref:Lrp/AsnC family transcriptional regulator n=1 Tax=Mucilaginibacter sp. Mucisp84 TaxID=3243058 RepID=UPI0039A585F9